MRWRVEAGSYPDPCKTLNDRECSYEHIQFDAARVSAHGQHRHSGWRHSRGIFCGRGAEWIPPLLNPSSTSANMARLGDGKTLDTEAVNHAIEAAAAAGGGVVFFPAGTYLCFSIHLKSQVHLYLEQGSAIVAADSPLPGDQTGYHGGVYDAAEPKTAWDALPGLRP